MCICYVCANVYMLVCVCVCVHVCVCLRQDNPIITRSGQLFGLRKKTEDSRESSQDRSIKGGEG